jgi:Flagellin and related hook-associated proteins
MTSSVLTNTAALAAIQSLNSTNRDLETVQSRISTGLEIAGAEDNASIFAVAQNVRADFGGLEAVSAGLDRATSIADVALAAGTAISNLLVDLREIVTSAADPSQTAEARALFNEDFQSILAQIQTFIDTADFDGANILDVAGVDIPFLAGADVADTLTLRAQNLTPGGAILVLDPATADISTLAGATTALADLITSQQQVNAALGELGADARAISAQNIFVSQLADSLTIGIGNLVDADLASESARLQALQVQQQLGTSALTIANAAPQSILALFG